jgi:hypothetical protein
LALRATDRQPRLAVKILHVGNLFDYDNFVIRKMGVVVGLMQRFAPPMAAGVDHTQRV